MKKPKLKTYVVPTIVHGCFGCDMEVEAINETEAVKAVLNGEGEMPGFDWDRWTETRTEIGTWAPVMERKP